jgi:chromosome segregation ATPase
MAARRLEMSIEQHKSKTTSQFAEIGKKNDALNRMKLELGEKTAAIFALEAREKALQEQLRSTTDEFSAKSQSLQSTEQVLTGKQDELAGLTRELADRSQAAENLQIELNAAKVTIETLNSRIEDSVKELASTRHKFDQQRIEAAATASELAEARSRVESLSQRVNDLDRQLVEQVKATETQASRGDELQNAIAAKTTLPAREGDTSPAAAMQQQADNAWATERAENALLRERINDIAAEVARLAMTLEGPESPIKAILAAESRTPAKPANGTTIAVQATLADRIRALQSRAAQPTRRPG